MSNHDPFTSDRYFVSQETDGSLELKAIRENTRRIADALDHANRIALMQTLPNGPKKDLLEDQIHSAFFKPTKPTFVEDFSRSHAALLKLREYIGGVVDESQVLPVVRGEGV